MKFLNKAAMGAMFLLGACAISQDVEPVNIAFDDICVVNNPSVKKEGFETAIVSALKLKGFNVRIVPETDATQGVCPTRVAYTANWSWDMAVYMRRADIIVYDGSGIAGRATYDATSGGANMGKFISAEEKVDELMNELFPPTSVDK